MSSSNSKKKKPADKPRELHKPSSAGHQTPRHSGLGRGLNQLIGDPNVAVASTGFSIAASPKPASDHTVVDIPAAEIFRSPFQPRQDFSPESIRELAESIRSNGLIQPLICRKNEDNRYELIAGERRLRAAIELGMTKVPVILREVKDDRQAAEMAIIENVQREDLNIIEEAEAYRNLTDNYNYTQQEVADRVGRSRSAIANVMRLLDLEEEVRQLVAQGALSTGHAKVLLGVEDTGQQVLIARRCVAESMTVRQLENLLKHRAAEKARENSGKPARVAQPDLPPHYVNDLVDRLHRHFGTSVRVFPSVTHPNGRHSKGSLEIDFFDNNDLNRLLGLLGISLD
ncbi:MAG: ParB/RepB/Spo0J family partition protein [Kiritimatiellae bacterium]|nr:ParB/RepB/Spo0J family partition protein [Kiritimatiellia bacterium]